MPDNLRDYSQHTIEKDCSNITGFHENELFFGCQFDKLNGLTLKDCVLKGSEFNTERILDALGFTLTLDCNSFRDVKYSPLLFDLLLVLLVSTKGNDDKRARLVEVIGFNRYNAIARLLRQVE